MSKKKLIVISHDAMVGEDLETLQYLPTFRELLNGAARVKAMRSVYPSLTYPVHASLSTGCRVGKHGILNNEIECLGAGPFTVPWRWFADDIQVPTVFQQAKKAGLTTASVFWPVTGNDPGIDYLVAEYWTQGPDDNLYDAFRRAGSSDEMFEKVLNKRIPEMEGHEKTFPWCEDFICNCACDIIREFQPDILYVHFGMIDGLRHLYGLFSRTLTAMLPETDKYTGKIMDACKQAGVFDDTNFVILSDHGHLNINRVLNFNALLKDAGFIRTDENDDIVDWDAIMHSCGLSGQIYVKDPSDEVLLKKVYDHLCFLRDEGIYGISRVFTAEEVKDLEGLYGNFSFMVESDGYTTFGKSDWHRPLVRPLSGDDWRTGQSTHGHYPDKGPQPTVIAKGPDFQPGAWIPSASVIDIAPTVGKLFGFEMPDAEGRALEELLK
ncbi:MAG: alkaline phosphatase family protein [Firmicutes bacterium]|nr:alkaline phosphatase family protein [Bacillota bacterium]